MRPHPDADLNKLLAAVQVLQARGLGSAILPELEAICGQLEQQLAQKAWATPHRAGQVQHQPIWDPIQDEAWHHSQLGLVGGLIHIVPAPEGRPTPALLGHHTGPLPSFAAQSLAQAWLAWMAGDGPLPRLEEESHEVALGLKGMPQASPMDAQRYTQHRDEVLAFAQEVPVGLPVWEGLGPKWHLAEAHMLWRAQQDGGLNGPRFRGELQRAMRGARLWSVLEDALPQLGEQFWAGQDALLLRLPFLAAELLLTATDFHLALLNGLEATVPGLSDPGPDGQALQRLAVATALASHGILRGPCHLCDMASWLVVHRPPGSKGRPPISDTLCPTCQVRHRRKVVLDSKQRATT